MEPTAIHIQPGSCKCVVRAASEEGHERRQRVSRSIISANSSSTRWSFTSWTRLILRPSFSAGIPFCLALFIFPIKMRAHLACLLLLCFTCGALCSGIEQDQRALVEDLLTSLFTSKIKHDRQSAPYWHVSLASLCRLVGGLRQPWLWSGEEEEGEVAELREGSIQLLEELYSLQHICRALQSREKLLQDSLEYSENSDAPLKRKSPYILKRQVGHNAKSRRPYILKRSTVY
ncbi:neurotensin/neuromedin N [Nothobranchius furzeri]|uniref:neurotensin/neuromedin N n=1 Tax=Nothobranchius furzeri TaxID=105023 RepID=UPI002404627B|nr:neurotensin/neuromedin N [Nothobranchius furzeri]